MDTATANAFIAKHGLKEVRRMAARSGMFPLGSRDSRGRLLPLRYRVAEAAIATKAQA